MPDEFVLFGDPERVTEETLHDIAHKMAQKLVPFIEYEQTHDPIQRSFITRARLRVADPYSLHKTTQIYRGGGTSWR